MRTFLLFLFFLPLMADGQEDTEIPVTYGVDIPLYKAYFRSAMHKRSSDSLTIPVATWNKINRQLDSLTNGLLRRHSSFVQVYISDVNELHEPDNSRFNDEGRPLFVRYRLVRELHLNNSIHCRFGFDTDSTGVILYKNELPFWMENKLAKVLSFKKAKRKLGSLKEIRSYQQGFFYHDPLLAKFIWAFRGIGASGGEYMVVLDAVDGKILDSLKLEKRFVPDGVLREAQIKD